MHQDCCQWVSRYRRGKIYWLNRYGISLLPEELFRQRQEEEAEEKKKYEEKEEEEEMKAEALEKKEEVKEE